MFKAIFSHPGSEIIYTIIGLLFFFVFFAGVVIYAMKQKKSELSKAALIPLDMHEELTIKQQN